MEMMKTVVMPLDEDEKCMQSNTLCSANVMTFGQIWTQIGLMQEMGKVRRILDHEQRPE